MSSPATFPRLTLPLASINVLNQASRVGTLMNFTMLVTVFVLQNVIGWILDLWPRTASGGWSATGYGWAMGLTVVAQAAAAAVVWALAPRRG